MSDDYTLKLKTNLPLAIADKIVQGALAIARAEGMLPLTVAVIDVGGNLIAFKREDGSGVLRGDVAFGKAWGALGMGVSSRHLRNRLADRPAFQGALSAASDGRFVPVPGGVLIVDANREVLGAVGISGDTSDKDEYAAIQAVQAAGLATHPEAAAENWRGSKL